MSDAKKSEYDKKLSEGVDTSNRRQLSDQELLDKFFKKNQNQAVNQKKAKVYFPVFYEGMSQPLTQIEVSFDTTIRGVENLKVDADAIINILEQLVDPIWMPKLSGLKSQCQDVLQSKTERIKEARQNGKIDTEAEDITCWGVLTTVSDENVVIGFDDKLLEIRIRVKPEYRSVKIASITNASQVPDDVTHEPSWISGYLNMNLTQNFQSDNNIYKNGREPIAGKYDAALNLGSLVLEAEGRSLERRTEVESVDPDFVREDTRFVYDFPSFGARSQAGDLVYPVGPFQVYRPLAGASVFTKSSLKASRTTLPGTNYDLNLARRSKVSIYINEVLTQMIDLPAGRHNLRDFPFTVGKNELKLEITDDLGRTEIRNYTVLLTNELLREGESEFSYAVGSPWLEVLGVRQYDSKNQTMSLYHRYGATQGLTLGAAYQADQFQSVGSLEFLFSTSIGYFSLIPAYSKNQDEGSGYAFKTRYTIEDLSDKEKGKGNGLTSFELLSTSTDFAELGNRSPINPTQLKFNVSHSRSLSTKTNINAAFSYSSNRETLLSKGDSYSVSLGSGQRWIQNLSTNIGFRHTRSMAGEDDISVNLFLIWTFPAEKQFVTVSSGGSSNSRIDWTNYTVGGVGSHRTRVNYQDKSKGPSYGGDFEYTANRAVLNASHQINIENADNSASPPVEKKSVHSTNLQFGTALVFAGGKLAVSKPVYDSFVIFNPLKNLNNATAVVNKQKDGSYIAATDWLGSAVAAELPSYYISDLNLDTLDSKATITLPVDHFVVKPNYKSGYVVDVGTNATVYLKTKLIREDGAAASMVSAYAINLDDSNIEPITIFTNRTGQVRSEGFRPGKYRLDFPGLEYEPTNFEIPDSASDEYDMPPLKLKVRHQ